MQRSVNDGRGRCRRCGYSRDHYTGPAVSSNAFRIIGYLKYASGLATAGAYASAPIKTQLFGPDVKKPGDAVQTSDGETSAAVTHVNTAASDAGLTADITPTSKVNPIRVTGTIQRISGAQLDLAW